jgi:hypothetical protein
VRTSELLVDAYGRVAEEVGAVLDGLEVEGLAWRPDPAANSIGWLVWHLTRVQDDHISEVAGLEQAWTAEHWYERFGLPFPPEATGYGQSAEDVGAVRVEAGLLAGYFDAVHGRTVGFLTGVTDGDLSRVVDERWDPPVTLGVRLVSVVGDDLQHVGQAAYLRGLISRGGMRG